MVTESIYRIKYPVKIVAPPPHPSEEEEEEEELGGRTYLTKCHGYWRLNSSTLYHPPLVMKVILVLFCAH